KPNVTTLRRQCSDRVICRLNDHVSQAFDDAWTDRKLTLPRSDRNKFLRGLPESPVDEIRCEAPHECEQIGLARPDLKLTRLEACKGLFEQLVRAYQSNALVLVHHCCEFSLDPWRHEIDHLHAGFLQLEAERLGIGVNRRLAGTVDRR